MIPKSRVILGRFPTPIHKFYLEELDEFELELWLKRDDSTSFDLGGNKVRKLEFLQAEALEGGYDCTITIGGSQSNHARATAISTRQVLLTIYIILYFSLLYYFFT
jgi:1-aminocyclopropane-1-carboxylate deaminase/D-cysteine desulfhydrase-like pyridoxal-dependent ACC family enzyme